MIFGIELSLFIAELGIVVTSVSAAAGIWIERDREKPLRIPITLTTFVVLASSLAMYQCRQDDASSAELQENLGKILEQLDVVATQSEVEVPELNDLLKSEIMMNGRVSPRVLMDMARRIAAKGGDPYVMLATYLPEAELQAMKRAGTFDEAMKQVATPDVNATKRRKLIFGTNEPSVRNDPDAADAGIDAAGALLGERGDAGVGDAGVGDAGVGDAGIAEGGAATETSPGAGSQDVGSQRAALKEQIIEARRKVAEAKTYIEKRDRARELFVLLGALDKLPVPGATPPPTLAASGSASGRPKKPEIEIEEDGTP